MPPSPFENDAVIYVILSVLLLMSVNKVFSQPVDNRQHIIASHDGVAPTQGNNLAAVDSPDFQNAHLLRDQVAFREVSFGFVFSEAAVSNRSNAPLKICLIGIRRDVPLGKFLVIKV